MAVKRYLLLLPVLLFPYVAALLLLLPVLFGAPGRWDLLPWTALVPFLSALVAMILAIAGKWDGRRLLLMNMLVKLIHIPAYLFFVVAGSASLIVGLFGLLLIVMFVVFGCLTILMTGMVGLSAAIRGIKEGKFSTAAGVLMGIAQFIFVADVVCAIVLFALSRRKKKEGSL